MFRSRKKRANPEEAKAQAKRRVMDYCLNVARVDGEIHSVFAIACKFEEYSTENPLRLVCWKSHGLVTIQTIIFLCRSCSEMLPETDEVMNLQPQQVY